MYKPQHLKFDAKATLRKFRVQVIALTIATLMAIGGAAALADQGTSSSNSNSGGNPSHNPVPAGATPQPSGK